MSFASVRKSRGVLRRPRSIQRPAEHIPAPVEGSGRRASGRTTRRLRRRPPTAWNAPPARLDGQAGGRVTGARAAEFSQSPNDGLHSARVGAASRPVTAAARHGQPRSAAICVSRSSPGLSPSADGPISSSPRCIGVGVMPARYRACAGTPEGSARRRTDFFRYGWHRRSA
jgi:hypothetical protein